MTRDISNNDLFFYKKYIALIWQTGRNSGVRDKRRNNSTLKRNEQQQIGSYAAVVCIGALRNDQWTAVLDQRLNSNVLIC